MNKLIAGFTALIAVLLAAAAPKHFGADEPAQPEPEPSPAVASTQPEKAEVADDSPVPRSDDSDTEMVMGIEVRKDRNCTVKQHMVDIGNGLVTDAYSCDPPETEDPFAALSDADLLVMSYSDASAAEELGKRLLFNNEVGPANEMMLRAVALEPDDVNPLRYLASQTGSLRGDSKEARLAVGNAYIISKTASYFEPSISTRWLESDLVEYRFTPEDIARLDKLVEGNLERMRKVQIDVFGESRIGEAL